MNSIHPVDVSRDFFAKRGILFHFFIQCRRYNNRAFSERCSDFRLDIRSKLGGIRPRRPPIQNGSVHLRRKKLVIGEILMAPIFSCNRSRVHDVIIERPGAMPEIPRKRRFAEFFQTRPKGRVFFFRFFLYFHGLKNGIV